MLKIYLGLQKAGYDFITLQAYNWATLFFYQAKWLESHKFRYIFNPIQGIKSKEDIKNIIIRRFNKKYKHLLCFPSRSWTET